MVTQEIAEQKKLLAQMKEETKEKEKQSSERIKVIERAKMLTDKLAVKA